jgi:hypothetical protein
VIAASGLLDESFAEDQVRRLIATLVILSAALVVSGVPSQAAKARFVDNGDIRGTAVKATTPSGFGRYGAACDLMI